MRGLWMLLREEGVSLPGHRGLEDQHKSAKVPEAVLVNKATYLVTPAVCGGVSQKALVENQARANVAKIVL